MNNKQISLLACFLLVFVTCSACTREDGKHVVDKNVIKDYVREPMNKAEGVKNKLEGQQDAMRRQADLMVDE